MVADTGGGLLFEPNDPASLAAALASWIAEPRAAAESGTRAQQAVHQRYTARQMAQRTIELYRMLLHGGAESVDRDER